MKADPRCLEIIPRKVKVQEGIERSAELILLLFATDCCLRQCPEGEDDGSGATELALW